MTSRALVDSPLAPPPIFIGGTGRSGTTILGDLLGRHASYTVIPIELRFHTDPGGLIDVLANRVTVSQFTANMLGPFFERTSQGGPRGLHLIADKHEVNQAVETFVERFSSDRFTAARDLILEIVQPTLDREGKQGWIEMTPWNVGVAATLYRIFPEMKLLHIVRDGRDVASSVADIWWGPENPIDGLHWWCERIRGAEAAARMLPPGTDHIIRFEELMLTDRKESLQHMCRYLEIDETELRTFFDTTMRVDRAHIGRWREDLDSASVLKLERTYGAMFDELIADRISCRPIDPRRLAVSR